MFNMLFSKENGRYRELGLFVLKVIVLIIPLVILFSILRSIPDVQATISESFPVYHLGKLIMVSAHQLLSMFGYTSTLLFDRTIYHYGVFSLQIPGGVQTFIGFSCLGLGIMWVYTVLIISWPGKIIPKTIYILIGLIMIFSLNVCRMSYLTWYGRNGLIFTERPISILGMKLDHHQLFNFFIYIVILALFILWIELFSKKYSNKN